MNNFIFTSALIAGLTFSSDFQNYNSDGERIIEIENSAYLEYGDTKKINSNTASVYIELENFMLAINDKYFFYNQDYPIIKKENFSEKKILSNEFDRIEAAIIDMEEELKVKKSLSINSEFGKVLADISGKLIYGEKQ